MKRFTDGDQMVFTFDDFVDLQESPAVFVPVTHDAIKSILEQDSLYAAPGEFLVEVRQALAQQRTLIIHRDVGNHL